MYNLKFPYHEAKTGDNMSADKNDKLDKKPDYSLIPKVLLDHLAYAMMAGEHKYGRYNYTEGHKLSQLTAAAVRHIKEIEAGKDYDADSTKRVGVDVHHAGNVAACMLMLLHQRELGTLVDDRYLAPEKTIEVVEESGYDIIRAGCGEMRIHHRK